jgi:hypothetical protein
MTCKQATHWLLQADDGAAPPDAVAEHLRDCRRCRRRRVRLRRLNAAVRRLPVPPDNPAARALVIERIRTAAAQQVPAATLRPPAARLPAAVRPWRRWLARAAMILVLVGGFGWLVLETGDTEVDEQGATESTDVVARLVERHLQLAEGLSPDERFQVFAAMAVDLRNESLRLAKQPGAKELPALARLYDKVVRDGLLARAGQLPEESRRPLVLAVVAELRQTENEARTAAAHAPPETAASLQALAASAQRARTQLAALLGDKTL